MGSLWAPQIRSSEPRRRSTLTAIQAPGLPIFCIPALRKPTVTKSILLEMQSYLFPSIAFTVMVACRTKVATPVMHYRIHTSASGHTQLGAALYRARGVCGCCAENDDMPYTDMKSSM